MTLKKLMIGVFAALCGTTVWAMRTVSLVSLDDGQARLAFSGEGPTASLVFCYGAENGGGNPDDWEHATGACVVLSNQTEATIPLPAGWGDTVRQGKFFLYDGIAKFPTYVSDGLVACWDAWDNSATGAHDAGNVTSWVDTVGGRGFTYVTGTDGNKPTVGEKSITFTGKSQATLDAESSSLLLDSGTNTVEAMFDDSGNGYSLTGTAASRVIWFAWYSIRYFSCSKVDENTGIARAGKTSTYAAVYDQTEVGKAKRVPQIACYRNGVDERVDDHTYWNPGGNQIVLGYNAASGAEAASPVFRTLRFYNRALTEDELKLNAYIDQVRYVTEETTENVVSTVRFTSEGTVMANIAVAAEHGTATGGGEYAFGATVTLTATPSDEGCPFLYWKGLSPDVDASKATVSFPAQTDLSVAAVFRTTYTPVTGEGRSIEVTGVGKNAQGVPVSVTVAFGETSRTDTLYVAYGIVDAGDDIGWWEHVEPVRAILPRETSHIHPLPAGWGTTVKALRFFFLDGMTADSYVKNHLVAQWSAEDATEDAWVDRIGGRAFALSNATVDGKSVAFTASSDSFGSLPKTDSKATFELKSDRTVESCIDFLATSVPNGVALVAPGVVMVGSYDGYGLYFTASGSKKTFADDMTSPAKRFSVVYDGGSTLMGARVEGREAKPSAKSSSWNLSPVTTTLACSGETHANSMACAIYGLRVYDTVLSDLEREVNCAVDGEVVFGDSTGEPVSCSEPLLSNQDMKGRFTVSGDVLCGTVSGTGTFDEDTEVTVSVTMDEGCSFVRWTGGLPEGVDPTSPTITFVLRGDVALTAKVWTPWMAARDDTGAVTELYCGDWRFKVTADKANPTKLTLASRVSGDAETLDISRVFADTGCTVVGIGGSLFEKMTFPKRVVHAGGELTSIGDKAFSSAAIETFEPEEIPSLTTIGTYAFSYSSLRGLRAPNITSVGSRAFDSATQLTNAVKDVIGFALGSYALQNTSSVKGALVIERTGSFGMSTFWGTGISNFTVRAQVSRVESFAFGSLAATAEIHWESKAPTELGTFDYLTQKIKAEGVFGRSAMPYTKLFARRDLDGWRKLAEFTPVDEIDDMYKTPDFGWTPKAIGWIDTVYSGHYRCWIVDDRRGLVLIVR